MATVDIKEPREQEGHFGLYRTSAGGDESIIVRRKVGEPTDYIHGSSRKLKRQREILALASQHYAHLSPSQKAILKHEFEEMEYQKSHGKTETKLLTGKQLFIARDIKSLETTGKQLILPHEVCIILADQGTSPLEGELWLRYLENGEWKNVRKEELAIGSWLFSQTPRGKEAYRAYGEAVGFEDPKLSYTQHMSEAYLLDYHYHHLYITGEWQGFHGGGGGYVAFWSFIASRSTSTIHLDSTFTTYAYNGDLHVGLATYPFDPDPNFWIAHRTYPIASADPDPKHIYTTLSGVGIVEGNSYCIIFQKAIYEHVYWEHSCKYYLIAPPPPPPE